MFLMDFLVAIFRKFFRRQECIANKSRQAVDQQQEYEQITLQEKQVLGQKPRRQVRRSLSCPDRGSFESRTAGGGGGGGRRRRAIDLSASNKRDSFQIQRRDGSFQGKQISIEDNYIVPPKQNRNVTIRYSKSSPDIAGLHAKSRSSASTPQNFIKDTLEVYQTINVIKQSGIKIVYSALDVYSKETVLIKLLNVEQCGSDHLKRFYKETRILNVLQRVEGVERLLGTIEEEPYKGLVLEYCRIQSLRSVLQIINGPLPECVVAIDILQHLLSTLANIHTTGIIHGTIEPEHILMSENMDVRLCGFSHAVEAGTELPYYRFGYVPYTAPEILNKPTIDQIFQKVVIGGMDESDLDQYSTQADVWSVGILVVELLLGYNPFASCLEYSHLATTTNDFIKKGFKRGGQLELASNNAKDFICNCLQLDPAKRATPQQLLQHKFVVQRDADRYLSRATLAHIIQEKVQSQIHA